MSETASPVRVGVVGLGRSGWGIHCKAFERLSDRYTVVAVADQDQARCGETAASAGCAGYASVDELAADPNVELVVIATPNLFHAPHALSALRAGKHVVCEKPFGLSVAETNAMIAAAADGQRVLAPFQNRRYEDIFRKVREVLRSGTLGRIVQIRMAYHSFGRRWDWQTLQSWGGGQLNNNGPHPIDQALVLYEDWGVVSPDDLLIFADLRNTLSSGDAEDHVRITLRAPRFPDAPTIDIEFTAASAFPQDQWHVMGTSGGLRGTAQHLEWKWVDWSALPPRPVEEASTPDRSYNRETVPWQTETFDNENNISTANERFYEDLYPVLRESAPLVITPSEIQRRIALIEKIRAAAATAGF